VIGRLIARAPEERYWSPVEVIRDLGRALERPLPVETAATRESFLQAAEFVGREKELSLLQAALDRAAAGQGSLILIAGESGVGKSRLLSELRTVALIRSVQVVRAQAMSEGGPSLHLWNTVLRTLCLYHEVSDEELAVLRDAAPDLPALLSRTVAVAPSLPPVAARARLYFCIRELLRRQKTPLLILLEDLHWAGQESLEVLRDLTSTVASTGASTVASLPILIVGTYRDAEAGTTLRTLKAEQLIKLNRFTSEGIAALSASMLGAVGQRPEVLEYLYRHTEGNALFVIEVVRALAEQAGQLESIGKELLPETLLPDGMERLIARRLDPLLDFERRLLELAAVAGRRIELQLLGDSEPTTDLPSWLETCANAGIIEAQQEAWQFSHDKIREWLLGSLPAERLSALHLRVAESIHVVYSDDPARDGALAFHYAKAGRHGLSYTHALRAGHAAARLYAMGEARMQYRAALSVMTALQSSVADSELPEIWRRRVDTMLLLVGSSYWSDSIESLSALLDECISLLDPLCGKEDAEIADLVRLTRVHYWLGRCRYSHGLFVLATESLRKSRELALRCGDERGAGNSLGLFGHIRCLQGHLRESLACHTEAGEVMARLDEAVECARNAGSWGLALICHGEVAAGMARLEQCRELGLGTPSFRAFLECFMCLGYRMCRRWSDMVGSARASLELTRAAGDENLGLLGLYFLARSEAGLGHFEAAIGHVREAQARFAGYRNMVWLDLLITMEAEVFLAVGNPEEAKSSARVVLDEVPRSGSLLGQGVAHRILGQALALTATPDAAADGGAGRGISDPVAHFTESLRFLESGEAWLEVAYTRVEWGRYLLLRGDTQAAFAMLQPALSILAKTELQDSIAEAQALLAQAHTR
jgi:hypothetical protein